MINVVIQGLGYVGSATALTIASKLGKNKKPLFNVIGIEKKNNENSKKLIDKINSKIFPYKSSDVEVKSLLKTRLNLMSLEIFHCSQNQLKKNYHMYLKKLQKTNNWS